MKLNRGFLNNIVAMTAIDKLAISNKMPGDIAYRMGKLHVRIKKEHEATRVMWLALLKKYCILDKDGNPDFKDGKPQFESKEKEEDHDKAFQEMMTDEFEERVLPVHPSTLQEAGLTPMEWIAIEPILEVVP